MAEKNTQSSRSTADDGANKKEAVAKTNGQSGALVLDPAQLEKDAGAGLSNVTKDDLTIPRLKALMATSPEVLKSKPQYVEGAQPGMILNTVTQELYDGDKGILVIPCSFVSNFVEWSPLGEGSNAPINIYSSKSDVLSKTTRDPRTNRDMLENGNYIERNANHFVLIYDEETGSSQPALLTFKSTGLKTSRKWVSLMMSATVKGSKGSFTPPSFALTYRLKTTQESNDKGSWVAWAISRESQLKDAGVYQQARDFKDKVGKDELKFAQPPKEVPSQSNKEETPF